MTALATVAVAFAMFSAIPVPQPVWNERNMRYALCAFPLIGVVCGLAWAGWAWLAGALAFPPLLRAGGLCLAPVLITGGIHLDGYADTSDALASCAEPARKREILADPHCGAFAVIRLCVYFTAYLALCAAVEPTPRAVLAMGLVLYLFRKNRKVQVAAFCAYYILYGVVYMGLMASYLPDFTWTQLFTRYYEIYGILAAPLMLWYNGERGGGHKALFYVFYPAHVYILYALSWGLYLWLK